MTPELPELFHIGWVVRDCAAAQRELAARLGAGPFVSAGTEARFDRALVHGKPTHARNAARGPGPQAKSRTPDGPPWTAMSCARSGGPSPVPYFEKVIKTRQHYPRRARPGGA